MKHILSKPLIGLIAANVMLFGTSGCQQLTPAPSDSNTTPTVPAPKPGKNLSAVDDSQSTAAGVEKVVSSNNKFALAMYQHLLKNADSSQQNIFFSPYSLSTAMAMLYAGAEGETKQQIQNTFYYPDLMTLNPNSAHLYKQFNSPNTDYKLATSNDLWVQQGLTPKPEYETIVRKYYGGEVSNLNFANDPEGSRNKINQKIANHTQQMIPNLLPQGSISERTKSVLTNSVYFKGDWKLPFESENTRKQPFHTFDGKTVNSDMMSQSDHFAYTENDLVQMVKLPYKGDQLSMMIILPKSKQASAMQKLVNGLTPDSLKQLEKQLGSQSVRLQLPKFKLSEDYQLKSLLSQLGMPKAFTSKAELSLFQNQSQVGQLTIDDVIHKAVVEVDEKGTEAAAATGITVGITSLPQYKHFLADHPFIFMIKDDKTDTILFLGQVNQP